MTSDSPKHKRSAVVNDSILKEIAAVLASLKYGDIVIKVHDSKVIQIEKTEKVRYENFYNVEPGGGI
jgi:hypothetical protein